MASVTATASSPRVGDARRHRTRVAVADRTRRRPLSSTTSATRNTDGGQANIDPHRRGRPLAPTLRPRLEASFGTDLSEVRVHHDAAARTAAAGMGAAAVTCRSEISIAERHHADDLGLMAHEVAHVLQQGAVRGAPSPQRPASPAAAAAPIAAEREATAAASRVRRGERVRIARRVTPGTMQADGEREAPGAAARAMWWTLDRLAPELAGVLREGVVPWIRDHVVARVNRYVDDALAPVRTIIQVAPALVSTFREVKTWVVDAVEKLKANDCKPLIDAAGKLTAVLSSWGSAGVDRLRQFAADAKIVIDDLWAEFGAPVWDFLQKLGGDAWEWIQRLGGWIESAASTVADVASDVWDLVTEQLGMAVSNVTSSGVWTWIRQKVDHAWSTVKGVVERFRTPLLIAGAVLLMLSPAGPLVFLAAQGVLLVKSVQWIYQYFKTGDVVELRTIIRTVVAKVGEVAEPVIAALRKTAALLVERFGGLVNSLIDSATALAGSALHLVGAVVRWFLGGVRSLVGWVTELLQPVVDAAGNALGRLKAWFAPVTRVLAAVGRVYANIFDLYVMVLDKAWNLVPACVRDPIVDFFLKHILTKVPFFAEVSQVPGIWTKIKATAMTVVRKVFREGDLLGAAQSVFELMLAMLQIPVSLLRSIVAKTKTAGRVILDDPLGFLGRFVRSLGAAFRLLAVDPLSHLVKGIGGWLVHQIKGAGFTPPADFTVRSIFTSLCEILGLTVDHVIELVGKKTSPRIARILRTSVKVLTGAWTFLAKLITEGPQAAIDFLMEKLSDLWTFVRDAAVSWAVDKLWKAAIEKIVSYLDPTGIMQVIETILAYYRAIKAAIEYARKILEIMDSYLDNIVTIATGSLEAAGTKLVALFDQALPTIIGFLAHQVGLGSLGERIQEVVAKAREKIDNALNWMIDKALAAGRSILDALGGGKDETVDQIHESFRVDNEAHELFSEGPGAELHVRSDDLVVGHIEDVSVHAAYVTYNAQVDDYETKYTTWATGGRTGTRPTKPHPGTMVAALSAWLVNGSPGRSAPGLGQIKPFRDQVQRLSKVRVWYMEAEHMIPNRWINVLRSRFGLPENANGSADYRAMHTILIYERAAEQKTSSKTAAYPGDNITDVNKLLGPTDKPMSRTTIKAAALTALATFGTEAVHKTNDAIAKEHTSALEGSPTASGTRRGETEPKPANEHLVVATKLQIDDVVGQIMKSLPASVPA